MAESIRRVSEALYGSYNKTESLTRFYLFYLSFQNRVEDSQLLNILRALR